MRRRYTLFCNALIACAVIAACQTALLSEQPRTVAEVLRERRIGLSKPELLKALRNPDSEIRDLAASQLAGDRAIEAVPEIANALSEEPDGLHRLNIAYALAQLGDQRGNAVLKKACGADAKPPNRVTAARYLLDLNDQSCLEEIVEMIESKDDPDEPQYAISLLPSFHQPIKELANRIRQIMINALNDSSPTVRITGAIAMQQLQDTSYVPYLRDAANRERDETVKHMLTEALKTLEKEGTATAASPNSH